MPQAPQKIRRLVSITGYCSELQDQVMFKVASLHNQSLELEQVEAERETNNSLFCYNPFPSLASGAVGTVSGGTMPGGGTLSGGGAVVVLY